ncbi:L-glutamate gamma-semialdehyde dehydrogenase [Alkalicoccus luteus]|uniref:L-glutamate gamma-semialdehyde dehydrogenase n=1 Tax=Alkalicoccus luteus TaxID=1237094 RepID=A0A969PMH2_9BACI|nr:L-glutamate gamma-semialdehyde dehydrogenase [Alkalicoccus luteus]NJP36135.1 L-glutamate gamma-semialdehyde dehydrogenase [Alkalicoccus luteus]NJP36143.1 L-glutamate gamma-semialdehyde dehydrogenase [Alkalicoccus luteus]
MYTDYKHEPFTDFTKEENQKEFLEALAVVKQDIGKEYPLVIDGKDVTTKDKLVSYNPCNHDEVIGSVSKASTKEIDAAFAAAKKAFPAWSQTNPVARAELLFRAAAIMRRRKHELSATVVKEAGKPWVEADIEVAEGIDFLEYYGRQMIELKDGKKIESRDGESNQYIYTSAGVAVTIPPWNFSAAIMMGTTVAPLVAGNTVLLKPAEPTPIIAAKFVDIMREAGVPDGVLNFVPGEPHEIGDYLVDHKDTALITFTGSKATGLRIMERAAKVQEGQRHLKRVLAEMGGKDTVVVDQDADVETAVNAIVTAAFNFSGQKCSAGSRAVIHEDLYDTVAQRVVEETEKLTLGDSEKYENYLGPVINQKAYDKVTSYIEIGKKEATLLTGDESDDSTGFFIKPTIFGDAAPDARIMQEEIFGPVLALCKASSYEEAIDIANNTEYGLTGAVISNNVDHLEYAKQNFHVGNLYFNRNCTGAIVGYHPFGGFKLSGTDSKAGGPDYLLQYLLPKSISQML